MAACCRSSCSNPLKWPSGCCSFTACRQYQHRCKQPVTLQTSTRCRVQARGCRHAPYTCLVLHTSPVVHAAVQHPRCECLQQVLARQCCDGCCGLRRAWLLFHGIAASAVLHTCCSSLINQWSASTNSDLPAVPAG